MILQQDWIRQLGTASEVRTSCITVDGRGNVYVSGYTTGELERGKSYGDYDAWFAKYDAEGNQQWLKQLGSSAKDYAQSIAVDGSGNVYLAGSTKGDLVGSSAGDYDAWFAKYNAAGNQQWIQQLGTASDDRAWSIAVDGSGNVYVAGSTEGALGGKSRGSDDVWLAKYDTKGTRQWIKQLGTTEADIAWSIAVDSGGNVYLAGYTYGALGGKSQGREDAWLAKYNTRGTRQWIQQLGTTEEDWACGIAVDGSGNVYVAGYTYGELEEGKHVGDRNAWLAKYDAEGTQIWIELLSSLKWNFAGSIAVDDSSNVYVAGGTKGAMVKGKHIGGRDAWFAKFDTEGTRRWIEQLGTAEDDSASGIAVDGSGNVYVTGYTRGDLKGKSHGVYDAWLAKYHQEPVSIEEPEHA